MKLSRWPHEFPKSYKQFRVMDLMQERNGLTYSEIIKYAFELSGKYKFDKVANRGYWSGAFQSNSGHRFYGSKVDGWVTVYCDKGIDGKYRVNGTGMGVLNDLYEKFKNVSVQDALRMKKSGREKQERIENFKTKYAEPLARFDARQEEKAERRISINDGVVTPAPNFGKTELFPGTNAALENITVTPTSTEVKLRGLKLDDKVAYRKTGTNESGVGVIDMVQLYGKNIANSDQLHIGIKNAAIPVSYNAKEDKFYHANAEIEIIKL